MEYTVPIFTRLQRERLSTEDKSIEIHSASHIRVPANGNIFLVLYNRGPEGALSSLDPHSIRVEGAIDAIGESVETLDPTLFNGASEAVALHFRDFCLNVAETGEICNYVKISGSSSRGAIATRRCVHVIDKKR
jgi:hypothetical protein